MKIEMQEISKLKDYMGLDTLGEFICNLEEDNPDYENIIEEIVSEYKHNIFEALREAIFCGFNSEILLVDCGISQDLIDVILDYRDKNIEVEL